MALHRRFWDRHTAALAVACAILMVLGIVVTWDAWRDILHIALRDEESSQVLLVPVVAGWLAWVRRRRLPHCLIRGNALGPLLMVVGWLAYCRGDTQMVQALWHAGAVLVVIGCLVSVLGADVLLQFLPAVVVLFFLVLLPGRLRQQVAVPMETAAACITQHILLLLGAPVARAGNLLTVNGVDVAIAEACNGLRMVFTLAFVSFAFAFGTPLRWYVRLFILAASPFSAVLCNVIRLVPTLWLYGYHPGLLAGAFHIASGWIMLLLSFLILVGLVRLLRWRWVPVSWCALAYD